MPLHGNDGPAAGTAPGENGKPIRCFAAAFLEPESAARLESTLVDRLDRRLRDRRTARGIPPERYHVTLKFFGDIAPAAVSAAVEAVKALNGHRVPGAIISLAGFPRGRSARLVAAELAADAQLEAWWAVLAERFGAEHARFRPHITVLRLRRPRTVRRVVLRQPLPVTLMAPRLYRSDQTEDGVCYQPLAPD